ncbi:MAG: restriction endonuclease subunit S [Burkholderiales bacterium]|nr:restriction endonuclease subunit S [Burkholderiales bacterium]
MIDGLKPYPAMKDSGVPWLGRVPEHWEVRRLGASIDGCINGVWGDEPNGVDDLPCVRVADFDRTRLRVRLKRPTLRAVPASDRLRRLLKTGDLLLEKSGGGDLQPVGVVMLYDHPATAVCSNFVARMPVARGFDPAYLTYLHSYLYAIRLNVRSIKQTTGIQNLDSSLYLSEAVAFPPHHEQAAIVRFLDHADRRIRRYIRVKQKLIKLMVEQKQAIIHRAVTRGLDANVRLKPSGVEWLGDVPEHWEVLTLRRVITRAVDGPHHSPRYLDSGIPFLSARNIKADRWSLSDAKYISEADYAEFSKRVVPELGDVLYTKGGTTGVARAVDLHFRFQVWVHVAVLKVKRNRLLPEYLALVLNSPRCYEQAQLFTRGATNQDLGLGRMKGIVFALPPLSEQEELLRTIEERTGGLNDAAEKARREIELLREYRVRLIADVVTGKLDVREAAARLPQEAEELEPLDEAEALGEADDESAADDLDPAPEEAEA